jgi:hemerythrin-like metal-binding protein
MKETGYLGAVQHRDDHNRFLAEIGARVEALHEQQLSSANALGSLASRLLEHVAKEDILFVLSLLPKEEPKVAGLESDEDSYDPISLDEILASLNEPMRWSANHATEIAPIDENHQIIFSRIRAIVDARNSASKEKLGEMLAQLGDETAEHFDAEERVMAEHHYEFAALHREEHRKLLEEFACQVEDFRNDVISVELMCRFVYGWFVRHIQDSDIPLSNALRRQMRA